MLAARIIKCSRNAEYRGGIARFPVPDDKVSWTVEWPEYKPVEYTAKSVLEAPSWADPDHRLAPPASLTVSCSYLSTVREREIYSVN